MAALQAAGLDLTARLEESKVVITLPKFYLCAAAPLTRRITKEVRERVARSFGEQAETSKRIVRDIRTTAINSTATAIKDLDARRQYEGATQKLYAAVLKKIDDLVAAKQKSILG